MKYLPGQPLGSIVAGGRGSGSSLDKITTSYAIDLDSQANIYISEYGNHRITKWMTTVAGTIVCDFIPSLENSSQRSLKVQCFFTSVHPENNRLLVSYTLFLQ